MKLRSDELLVGAAGAGSSAAVALGYGDGSWNKARAAWAAGTESMDFRNQMVCGSCYSYGLRRP